jgi:hypothetical protein
MARSSRPRGDQVAPPLFVVYDTGGAGRLVGVFDDAARADAIVRANPAYFRLTRCTPNTVTRAALAWASPDVRSALEA